MVLFVFLWGSKMLKISFEVSNTLSAASKFFSRADVYNFYGGRGWSKSEDAEWTWCRERKTNVVQEEEEEETDVWDVITTPIWKHLSGTCTRKRRLQTAF